MRVCGDWLSKAPAGKTGETTKNDKLNTLDSGECSSKLYSPFFHPRSRNKLNLERT